MRTSEGNSLPVLKVGTLGRKILHEAGFNEAEDVQRAERNESKEAEALGTPLEGNNNIVN